MFKPHPRPPSKVPAPTWVVVSTFVSFALIIFGGVFVRIGASGAPNLTTGQIYAVYLGRGGNHFYVNSWHYTTYQIVSWAGIAILAIAMLYMAGKNLWFRYGR